MGYNANPNLNLNSNLKLKLILAQACDDRVSSRGCVGWCLTVPPCLHPMRSPWIPVRAMQDLGTVKWEQDAEGFTRSITLLSLFAKSPVSHPPSSGGCSIRLHLSTSTCATLPLAYVEAARPNDIIKHACSSV